MKKKKSQKSRKQEEIELQKQREQFILNYRNSIEANKNKSQDDFEKYINLLASGGLVISLTILEKITDKSISISCICLFFLSILCFTITLLLNLISHRKSIDDADYILDKVGYDNIENLEDEAFITQLKERNETIENFNNLSIYSLIAGVFFIFIFLGINLLK